jgi:hypothetical protein
LSLLDERRLQLGSAAEAAAEVEARQRASEERQARRRLRQAERALRERTAEVPEPGVLISDYVRELEALQQRTRDSIEESGAPREQEGALPSRKAPAEPGGRPATIEGVPANPYVAEE